MHTTKNRAEHFSPNATKLILAALLVWPAIGHSQTYIPDNDDVIVEDLPSPIVAMSRELRSREVDSLSQLSPDALLQQAWQAYRIAVSGQSPRAWGRTMSLLQRWPQSREKPADYHNLMAAVLQHNHEFSRAIEHLDMALATDPDNSQAMLIKAQIGLVNGQYAMAGEYCTRLRMLVRYPISLNCQAQLDGVTGQAERALADLDALLADSRNLNPGDRTELRLTAAVISHRLARTQEAENHYRHALQLAPATPYALVHYSSLLLESDRPADVVTLLDAHPGEWLNTELRILLAEALQSIGSDTAQARSRQLVEELQAEFDATLLRGEAIPYKAFAHFSLNLLDRPGQALSAARDNWSVQKEPSDTLLLARAAAASGDTTVLSEIGQWLEQTGTEHVRLRSLLRDAGVMP
ncbi:MAG: hypothetical protein WEB57_11105 [Pseudohongiellaceae bacterium]